MYCIRKERRTPENTMALSLFLSDVIFHNNFNPWQRQFILQHMSLMYNGERHSRMKLLLLNQRWILFFFFLVYVPIVRHSSVFYSKILHVSLCLYTFERIKRAEVFVVLVNIN